MEGAATENAAVPVGAAAPEAAVHSDERVESGGAVVEDSAASTVAPESTSDADQVIEDAAPEDGVEDADQAIEDAAPEDWVDEDTVTNVDVSPEDMRSIIEVIADTGKFWHDWRFLKSVLSIQMKQVLDEYFEVEMVSQNDGQQRSFAELFSRLNGALERFEEGPPFTLQRLCEILLDPKGTYTKLSKLAFALEKNLLVTSTITKCTDPYPAAHGLPCSDCTQITENSGPADVDSVNTPEHTTEVPNGTEHVEVDVDEEMADAEEAEESSGSHDVEMQEDKPDQVDNVNSDVNTSAAAAPEAVNANESTSQPQC